MDILILAVGNATSALDSVSARLWRFQTFFRVGQWVSALKARVIKVPYFGLCRTKCSAKAVDKVVEQMYDIQRKWDIRSIPLCS